VEIEQEGREKYLIESPVLPSFHVYPMEKQDWKRSIQFMMFAWLLSVHFIRHQAEKSAKKTGKVSRAQMFPFRIFTLVYRLSERT
jgi:hypothetical protein